jgi:hypothetical protein
MKGSTMANRSYDFEITWCYKEDGNRPDNIEDITTVRSTTVGRAVSKLVRELNDGLEKDDEEFLRASDLLVIDVRNHKLTSAIIEKKRELGQLEK